MPRRRLQITRDLVMFALGAAAFTYETVTGGDRPNVLYLAGALMGIAAYLRGLAAAKKNGNGNGGKP